MSLKELVHPFAAIAQELRIIRELYEMDLASRSNPLIRVTEEPKKGDTTVMYGDETEDTSKLKQLMDAWDDGE